MLNGLFDSVAIMMALACFKTRSIWMDAVEELGEDVEARKKEVTDKALGWWLFITDKAKNLAEKRMKANELTNKEGVGAEMYDIINDWGKTYFNDEETRKNFDIEFELSDFVDMEEEK